MPVEAGLRDGNNNQDKFENITTRHKESLLQMKSLLSSIVKFKATSPTEEIYSLVVKKFMFTVSTICDDYFLSDVCELAYELFVEFRLALGYFQSGKFKRVAASMADTVEMCTEITNKFRDFLTDPGYRGTNFPKPAKLKAMRELAGLVADNEDVFVLRKANLTTRKKKAKNQMESNVKGESRHVAIDMNIRQDTVSSVMSEYIECSEPIDSCDSQSSTASTSTDSSSIHSIETPHTPQLSNEEISGMKSAAAFGGLRKGSMLVAAMGDLMPPPPPPVSNHGRIRYVDIAPPSIPFRRASNPYTSSQLRPPILVDDEGDILPSSSVPIFPLQPQLKSAAASIYESSDGRIIVDEHRGCIPTPKGFTPKDWQHSRVLEDDDSFIQAYREYAMESGHKVHDSNDVEGKRATRIDMRELDSSGWSLKNRN